MFSGIFLVSKLILQKNTHPMRYLWRHTQIGFMGYTTCQLNHQPVWKSFNKGWSSHKLTKFENAHKMHFKVLFISNTFPGASSSMCLTRSLWDFLNCVIMWELLPLIKLFQTGWWLNWHVMNPINCKLLSSFVLKCSHGAWYALMISKNELSLQKYTAKHSTLCT